MKSTHRSTARRKPAAPIPSTPGSGAAGPKNEAAAAVAEESPALRPIPHAPHAEPEAPPAIERRRAPVAVAELERVLGVKLPEGSALSGLVESLAASDAAPLHRSFRLDEGGAVGLELVRIARRPDVLARLEDLECQSWSCASIDALEGLAEAAVELYTLARHARRHLVSPALLAEALARRDRLLALLLYHFAKDEEMMKKAAQIDPGKTQAGLASALIDLHALLAPHQAFLSHDRTAYDATDFVEAPKLAQRIMRGQAAPVAASLTAVRRGLRGELVRAFDDVRLAVGFVTHRWSQPPALPTLGELTRERRKRQGGPSEAQKAKRAERKAKRQAEAEAKKAEKAAKKAAKEAAKAAAKEAEAKAAAGAAKAGAEVEASKAATAPTGAPPTPAGGVEAPSGGAPPAPGHATSNEDAAVPASGAEAPASVANG